MLKFVFIPLLFVGFCSAATRIVNGTDAEDGEFAFAVSLRYLNSHLCGGTILNEKFVLTAAHCTCYNSEPEDVSKYSIQYGLTDITPTLINVVPVKTINCNNFSLTELTFDSAVLELESSLPKNGNWTTVQLSREFDTSVEQKGEIMGWGALSDNGPYPSRLQKLQVDVYDNEVCGQHFNNEQHICFGADHAGACGGDSGTALLVGQVQVGICSFKTTDSCGVANKTYPNVYSRVATYYDWIESIVGDLS